MINYSIGDKLKMLVEIIMSSPLFLCCFMIGIAFFIYYIISIYKNNKINKWVFVAVWVILLAILVIRYNKVVLSLFDNLFENIFMALYFPNLAVYIVILFISNIMLIYSILNRSICKSYKITNVLSAFVIDIFLVLIVDIVNKNSVNVYKQINVYTNPDLLVLLQLTTAVFVSWLLINLFITAHRKLKKYDKKQYPDMPEIIFD